MILKEVLQGKKSDKIPFWFMRQAGRYLPEYMEIRNHARANSKNFLDMCYDVELATKITLQPIERFDMSAVIIFSDILTIPDAMGWDVQFKENIGPVLQKFENQEDLVKISQNSGLKKYNIVADVIKNVRSNLSKNKAVIGFSGCPFTLACYMIQGGGSKDFEKVLKMVYENESLFSNLIKILTKCVIDYLCIQIDSGADVIQIFESHAGILHGSLYEKYIIQINAKIVNEIKLKYPNVPIIAFPRGSGMSYKNFSKNVKCDGISIDNSCDDEFFKKNINNKVIQGNLNNYLLCYGSIPDIKSQVRHIIQNFQHKPFIFNLSHGVLKETPIKNIHAMIEELYK